jgi:hypothetical protein
VEALPPATPFTLQVTVVFVVLVTVALKFCMFPNKTEALVGVMVTVMEGGGGGGGVAPGPPPQPDMPKVALRSTRNCSPASDGWAECSRWGVQVVWLGVRGRMQGGMQANGQRKDA